MTKTETPFAQRMNNIPESFIREILKVAARPEVISFAGGLPNPAFFPVEKMAAAAEKVIAKDGSVVLQYAATEGYPPLRDYIAQRQNKKQGTALVAEDVLILNGSQQGLDLIGKIFVNPGSDVLMEEPSYLGAIQAFSAYEPTFHEVEMDVNGPKTEHLKKILDKHEPVFFYAIPNFQNPTGKTYDLQHRHDLVDTMHPHDTLLIEDNPYGDIHFKNDKFPDLQSLMPSRTIQLGSFSKIISPGLRLGWAIAPQPILRKMTIAKQASDLHSSNLGQRILYQFLMDNSLEDHLESVRAFYKQQAELMCVLMKDNFPDGVQWINPTGGMFVWVTLPDNMDATILLREAVAENIVFVPGQNFFIDQTKGKNTIRLNFSNPSVQQMDRGIKSLARIISRWL